MLSLSPKYLPSIFHRNGLAPLYYPQTIIEGKNKTNFKPAEFLYPKDSHFGKFITRILDKVSKKKNVHMYRNCKNIEIFTTLFIRTLIDQKWKSLKWIHYIDSLLYIIYLVSLCIGSYGHSTHWVLTIGFLINQILLLYEVLQMISSKILYFTSFLNYLDMFRSVLFNLYCLVEYYDYHESKQYPILLITIVLSLIRGFGYFKVFFLMF